MKRLTRPDATLAARVRAVARKDANERAARVYRLVKRQRVEVTGH